MKGRDAWIAPLGIAVSLLLALLTSDFHGEFGLSADAWKAIFIIALFLSCGWLIRTWWKRPKSQSIEEFIEQLKPEK